MKAGVHSSQAPILSSMGYKNIGTHYFAQSSAIFKFSLNNQAFKFVGGRLENIPAPYDSVTGSVDWLKLGRTTGLESQSRGVKVG